MSRKHNVDEIDLKIENIEVYPSLTYKDSGFVHDGCIRIFWSSSIGFGQYDLWKDSKGNWCGDSECMDSQEDKDFIKKLLSLLAEKLIIID